MKQICPSIKRQLILSVLTASIASALLIAVVFLTFYCYSGRRDLIEHTRIQAVTVKRMLPYSDGPTQANELLSRFVATDKNVDSITVYHDKYLYAAYPSNVPSVIDPPTRFIRFTLTRLYVSVSQEQPPGEIHVVVKLSSFYSGVELLTLILFLATLATAFMAYSLAARTASSIIRPLQELASLVTGISETHDFKARAPGYQHAELESLSKSFNILLNQIQIRDIELAQNTANLEREVKIRTEAIESAKLKAEQASKAKSTFLANMSHELRTPLTSIRMYSELVKEDLEEGVYDAERHIMDMRKVLVASDHLLALIEDILDLAKIESSRTDLNLVSFDLKSILTEIIEQASPLASMNDNILALSLDISKDLHMFTDPTRLKQILLNLLSNSAKFTDKGSITLRANQLGEYIIFQVEDSGIGMTPDQVDRVWEEFVQADSSTSKKYGGTGLGLALTRRLSLALGGSASMESTPHVGTVVTVKLPLQAR